MQVNRRILYTSALATGTGGGGPVFSFKGSDTTNGGSATFTSATIDIGAAAADRFVIVALVDQNGVGLSSVVTVNGVNLAQDVQEIPGGGAGLYIYSGLVSSGSGVATIVAPFAAGAAFTDRTMSVWIGNGMSLTSGAAHVASSAGTASLPISVAAGDFLIAVNKQGANFSGSTETTTNLRSEPAAGASYTQMTGEWNTIIANNGSFAIVPTFTVFLCAATYH